MGQLIHLLMVTMHVDTAYIAVTHTKASVFLSLSTSPATDDVVVRNLLPESFT
jgi:hypothetical protein